MAGNHSNRTQVRLNTVRCSEESAVSLSSVPSLITLRSQDGVSSVTARLHHAYYSTDTAADNQRVTQQPVMISTVYFNCWCALSSEAQPLLNRGWERSSDTIGED